MFGNEAFGTKYYGSGEISSFVVSEYPIKITIKQSDIYQIEIVQAETYNITISVTGGGS